MNWTVSGAVPEETDSVKLATGGVCWVAATDVVVVATVVVVVVGAAVVVVVATVVGAAVVVVVTTVVGTVVGTVVAVVVFPSAVTGNMINNTKTRSKHEKKMVRIVMMNHRPDQEVSGVLLYSVAL